MKKTKQRQLYDDNFTTTNMGKKSQKKNQKRDQKNVNEENIRNTLSDVEPIEMEYLLQDNQKVVNFLEEGWVLSWETIEELVIVEWIL